MDDGDRCGAGTRKRDLAPDWRDALRASVQALRRAPAGGALLVGAQRWPRRWRWRRISSTDPQLDHRRRRPADQLGWAARAPMPATALLLLFGIGSALFAAGRRACRAADAAPRCRRGGSAAGLLIAALGAVLVGTALSLTSGSAVSGLPERLGRRARRWPPAHGVELGARPQIGNPSVARADAARPCCSVRDSAASILGISRSGSARTSGPGSRSFGRGDTARTALASAIKPKFASDRPQPAAPPRARPAVAVAEPARVVAPAARGPPTRKAAQPGLALGDSYPASDSRLADAAAQRRAAQPARPRRARAQCAAARIGARRLSRPRRHRRGPPRPGRHHVRTRTRQRHQGQPGDPAGRRCRAQHVGARRRASRPFRAAA